jgi:hypothetical protein
MTMRARIRAWWRGVADRSAEAPRRAPAAELADVWVAAKTRILIPAAPAARRERLGRP